MRGVLCCVLLVAVVFVAALPVHAVPKASDKWIRAETPNFTLFSNAGSRRTLNIAQHLEQLREVLIQTSPELSQHSPLATRIYVFKNEAAFGPYKLGEDGAPESLVGYFVGSEEGNYVAVDASARGTPFEVIDHEYLHYVLRNNVPNIPLWLNEGLAEFYSSFTVFGGRAEIGRPIEAHLKWLSLHPPIPLAALLEVTTESPEYNESDRVGTFYARSWALAHFLATGPRGQAGVLGKMLHLMNQGAMAQEALTRAYGKGLSALETELAAYMQQGTFTFFRYTPEEPFDQKNIQERPLERAEVLYHLGDLLAHHPPLQFDGIEEHMRGVLALDATHAAAYLALADLRLKQDRQAEAEAFCKQALQHDPKNGRAHLLSGMIALSKLTDADFTGVWTTGKVSEKILTIREHFRLAAKRMPNPAEALAMLGHTYLYQQENVGEGLDALRQAAVALPARTEILRSQIILMARSGQREAAEQLFQQQLRPRGEASEIDAVEMAFLGIDVEEADRLYKAGQVSEAIAMVQQLGKKPRPPKQVSLIQSWLTTAIDAARANNDVDRYNQAVQLASAGNLRHAVELFEQLAQTADREDLRTSAAEQAQRGREIMRNNAFVDTFNDAVALARAGSLKPAIKVLQGLIQEQPGGELEAKAKELLQRIQAADR